MGGEVIPVGPFPDGLNIADDPRSLTEGELSVCTNFDIDRRGGLKLRQGLLSVNGPAGQTVGNSEMLAVSRSVGSADSVFMSGYNTATGKYRVWQAASIHAPVWTNRHEYTSGKAGTALQYNSSIWVPNATVAGGGLQFNHLGTTVVSVPAMPVGNKAFIYKDRMFLFDSNSYRVYYSTSLDPSLWPAANFFDINAGDGEPIRSAVISGESVIFFKQNSTWILYFDTDPGLGTLRKLNTDVGVSGPDSTCVLSNDVYVINYAGVFRLTNSFFESISDKLDLVQVRGNMASQSEQDFITPIGDKRLLVRVYTEAGTYRYFVYHIDFNAWTEYSFNTSLDLPIQYRDADNYEHYVAVSKSDGNVHTISAGEDTTATEFPVGVFTTKSYDYGDAAGWKRMFWFSVEARATHAFSVSTITDSETLNTAHVAPANSTYGIFKNFLSNRFRTIKYSLTAGGNSGEVFELIQGTVSVSAKKRVVDRETV